MYVTLISFVVTDTVLANNILDAMQKNVLLAILQTNEKKGEDK